MTTEIVARFADGRLLVQESKAVQSNYVGSGVPFRIGHIKTVERVLSVTTDFEKHGIASPLDDVKIGGPAAWYSGTLAAREDHVLVTLRRADIWATSGQWNVSGAAQRPDIPTMSAVLSGLAWMGEVLSGYGISGRITITANVIGY